MHIFGSYLVITLLRPTWLLIGDAGCIYANMLPTRRDPCLSLASLGGGDMTQAVDRDYVLSSPTYQVKAQVTLLLSGQLRGLAATL
jgi:hypothetical protein